MSVYLRTRYETGEIYVKLITAKAKVCPASGKTIPKLELYDAKALKNFPLP